MSLLYDKLYRSADYSELSIKEYLTSLIDDVLANFPNSLTIRILKNLQDFELDAKRMQPIGIIINELLTNIMKYAFKGRDAGMITVSATNVDGHIALSVEDDGIGMPESVSFENSTGFGLQLVHALTQQLQGTIRIERGTGTKVVIELEDRARSKGNHGWMLRTASISMVCRNPLFLFKVNNRDLFCISIIKFKLDTLLIINTYEAQVRQTARTPFLCV